MAHGEENLEIGKRGEHLFRNRLNKNQTCIDLIKKKYNVKGNLIEAHVTGGNNKKSDVLLLFSDSTAIGVNIKSGKAGFNQITRIWLDKFSDGINLSLRSKEIIQNGIDNYRIKKLKYFIDIENQSILAEEIKEKIKIILELIFRGIDNEIAKLLTIYNRNNDSFYIYDLEEILEELSNSEITFSNKGIIQIGNYITIQRKGGNGHTVPYDKSDPRHPGNQIQFKMKILSFAEENSPFFTL